MISDADADFHDAPADDPTWAETNYFGLYVAEVPLNIGLYALFRPNLGVVNTTVCVNSREVTTPWEADYWDAQAHVPIPEPRDLRSYSLANGLRVEAVEPNRVWDVRYEDPAADTSIAFRYTALVAPFDIHDPEQDPMVAAQAAGSDFAWGTAYNGHFDQTGRYEGELVLRGRRHAIDCVSTMDHSWGPRGERHSNVMSWLHAHVDADLAIHGIFSFDPDTIDGESPLRLAHGYVAEKGELVGLRAGSGVSTREGLYPRRTHLEVVDARDRTWTLDGEATTTFPWQAWPGVVGFNVLHRWRVNGREGWGEAMDFLSMEQITALYAGRATA